MEGSTRPHAFILRGFSQGPVLMNWFEGSVALFVYWGQIKNLGSGFGCMINQIGYGVGRGSDTKL